MLWVDLLRMDLISQDRTRMDFSLKTDFSLRTLPRDSLPGLSPGTLS
jgi:hypothetical protein